MGGLCPAVRLAPWAPAHGDNSGRSLLLPFRFSPCQGSWFCKGLFEIFLEQTALPYPGHHGSKGPVLQNGPSTVYPADILQIFWLVHAPLL